MTLIKHVLRTDTQNKVFVFSAVVVRNNLQKKIQLNNVFSLTQLYCERLLCILFMFVSYILAFLNLNKLNNLFCTFPCKLFYMFYNCVFQLCHSRNCNVSVFARFPRTTSIVRKLKVIIIRLNKLNKKCCTHQFFGQGAPELSSLNRKNMFTFSPEEQPEQPCESEWEAETHLHVQRTESLLHIDTTKTV